ncbi:ficolin-3-like [Pecten maximus]|uniref:ficolin-3-like n=1 Tax=Pecten maximus TaxID=6579 RepID=UPI0014582A18|nr:ficolin-3-like [Pecten maximus]
MNIIPSYLILMLVFHPVLTETKRSSYVMYQHKNVNQNGNYAFLTLQNISTLQLCATNCHFDSKCNAFTFQADSSTCQFVQNGSFPYSQLKSVFASQPQLCHDMSSSTPSGVYSIVLAPPHIVEVYCDMDTLGGGWTVIQNRYDGSVDFYKTWEEYKAGFGNARYEYWLGNENIHLFSSLFGECELGVEIADVNGLMFFATYDRFLLAGESDDYRLTVLDDYVGDMYHNKFQYHQYVQFSTKDRENDHNCSQTMHGGWWYSLFSTCGGINLNGRYDPQSSTYDVMHWEELTVSSPFYTPLSASKMMIRPKS